MKWYNVLVIGVVVALALAVMPVRAQDEAFPLPAPLYILTSQHEIIAVDPANGGQAVISQPEQPVIDFDIAPDGEWIVYRTTANSLVVVTQLAGRSGYVLEFADGAFPASGPAQTIAWSPDAARIAYIIGEGVRIAELGAGDYGQAQFSTVQGPWIELYWTATDTLIASDANGQTTRIHGTAGRWSVEVVSGVPARPQPPVPSYLSAQGVVLAGGVVVPGTAGALAFEWGPPPLPIVSSVVGMMVLPADLYFLAPDASGVTQVWRLPRDGALHALTAERESIASYGLAPDATRIAFVIGDKLVAARADGSARRELATLALQEWRAPRPSWSADATHIAYHDRRGVWVVPADGSSPPRLLAQNVALADGVTPADVRVYYDPVWSADGTRLLVTIGLWEGAIAGIVDVATGVVSSLGGVLASASAWTASGRVLVWNSAWGYQEPGLFLLDPGRPDAPPQSLFTRGAPVFGVQQDAGGRWHVLTARTAALGPQFLFVAVADSLQGPYQPLYGAAGGFAPQPVLGVAVPGQGPDVVAGLRAAHEGAGDGMAGDLILVDMSTGGTIQIETPGPVSAVQWGPGRS